MTTRGVMALWVAAVLAGCHGSEPAPAPASAPSAAARAPAPVQRGPTAEELTVGMVEAAAQGKGRVPVLLKFELVQRPAVGQLLEVSVALIPSIAAGPVTLKMAGGDGIDLAPGYESIEIESVDADQAYRHSIKLTPGREGVVFLTVDVTLKHDEIADTQNFSIPIIVPPK